MKVLGIGKIQWCMRDVYENTHEVYVDAYYIPDAGVRLFSPQQYFQLRGQNPEPARTMPQRERVRAEPADEAEESEIIFRRSKRGQRR